MENVYILSGVVWCGVVLEKRLGYDPGQSDTHTISVRTVSAWPHPYPHSINERCRMSSSLLHLLFFTEISKNI